MDVSSERTDVEFELMDGGLVGQNELLAPGDVLALELAEGMAIHDLIDHELEVSAGGLNLAIDLALQSAAVLGGEDASACQEA